MKMYGVSFRSNRIQYYFVILQFDLKTDVEQNTCTDFCFNLFALRRNQFF